MCHETSLVAKAIAELGVYASRRQDQDAGPDEEGEGKKSPPRHIEEKWIQLRSRAGEDDGVFKDMRLSEVFSLYQDYLKNPRTRRNTTEHHNSFLVHIGDRMKVSSLRVHHITEYLGRKDWSSTMKATAMERIKTAVNWAVGQQYIDKRHKMEIPKSLRPKRERRKIILTAAQQELVENAANPSMRALLIGLRLSGHDPASYAVC